MQGILMSLSLILVLEAVGTILTLVLFLKFVDAAAISIASMVFIEAGSLTAALPGCQISLAFLDSIRTPRSPEF
jgi:hypothetical protein